MNFKCPRCNSSLSLSVSDKLSREKRLNCSVCHSKLVLVHPHSDWSYLLLSLIVSGIILMSGVLPILKLSGLLIYLLFLYVYDFKKIKINIQTDGDIKEESVSIIWVLALVMSLCSGILYFTNDKIFWAALSSSIVFILLGGLEFLNHPSKIKSYLYVFLYSALMLILFEVVYGIEKFKSIF